MRLARWVRIGLRAPADAGCRFGRRPSSGLAAVGAAGNGYMSWRYRRRWSQMNQTAASASRPMPAAEITESSGHCRAGAGASPDAARPPPSGRAVSRVKSGNRRDLRGAAAGPAGVMLGLPKVGVPEPLPVATGGCAVD